MRRAYLDLHGVVPTIEQAAAFLADKRPDKRARLIDALLDDPTYGRHLAELWSKLLLPVNAENRRCRSSRWLPGWPQGFNENRPWNEIVHAMLTAVGPQYVYAAVTPFMANSKSLAPHEATDLVARVFLGVRVECAQCHDHPFDRWKQTDYWGLAAFFRRCTSPASSTACISARPPRGPARTSSARTTASPKSRIPRSECCPSGR